LYRAYRDGSGIASGARRKRARARVGRQKKEEKKKKRKTRIDIRPIDSLLLLYHDDNADSAWNSWLGITARIDVTERTAFERDCVCRTRARARAHEGSDGLDPIIDPQFSIVSGTNVPHSADEHQRRHCLRHE